MPPSEPVLSLSWVDNLQDGRTPYPPFIDQRGVDELLARLVVRPSDVFVASYPKSGTTWLQQICHLLERGGVQGPDAVVDTVPWVEAHALPEKPSLDQLEAQTSRRWMQIHAPVSLAPKGSKGSGARYLYVARNPRDVAVSFYCHQRAKQRDPPYTGDFADFLERFAHGRVPFGSWFEHVVEWWTQSQARDDILFLRYEDMVRDLGAQLDRIVAFLGLPLEPGVHEAIVEQSSFAHMKARGIGEPKGEFRSRTGESAHLRKGVVGDWRNWFSAAQVEALDALYRERVEAKGLRFEFT